MKHPVVMFEVLANAQKDLLEFYTSVFGWTVEYGKHGSFAYIKFPTAEYTLLGGIGQAQPNVLGWGPGTRFYIQVDDLEKTLLTIDLHGGQTAVPPTSVDGYHFAMFFDPEKNLVGLIRPFAKA